MGVVDAPTVSVAVTQDTDPAELPNAPAQPGDQVGRYILDEELGRGGMAQVFLAHDPELDREVALKLILPARSDAHNTEAQRRLLREAQALARLSHPNVVTVYDAGTHLDRVFIAMARVSGTTLRDWLKERNPSWREAVAVMLAAGHGLAAAHAAELVHRDFKPANVMIDDSGKERRVLVLDFGLAREARIGAPVTDRPSSGNWEDDSLSDSVTRTGFVVGTPQYMAPEQFQGGIIDHRTDLFSYCVALYQVIYGERPWVSDGERRPGRAAMVRALEFPATPAIPRGLKAALRRGLSAAPHERYDSMDELLVEIRRSLARRRLPAAFVGLLAVGGVAAWWGTDRPGPCDAATDAVGDVWSDAARARVRAGLEATGPNGTDTARRAVDVLDEYAAAWTTMRVEACAATHEASTQSEAVLDLRMACLDRRRDAFGAVTRLMTEADEKIGARAIQAALELPTLDSCADADVLQRTAPRPTDPAVLAELEQVEAEVASVLALEIAGRYPDGLERSRRLLSRAEAIGYEPLLATLLFKLGYCEHVLGDKEAARAAFDRALGHAQNSGADDLAAQVLVQQVALIGHGFSDIESAIRIAGHAESAIARVGSPARLMGRLRVNLANAQMRAGNIEEGKRLYEEAMEVTESTPAARVTWRAAQANLAVVYARLGDNARAVESWTRALDTLRHDFGEHHPEYAVALTNLGVARFKLGRPNAREDLESALVLFERVDMERSIGAATAHHNLGLLLRGLGDLDGARDHYEQALSIKRELRGPDDTSSAMTATNLASLLSDLEPSDEVVAMAADAQAILRRELGADNPVTAAGIASYGKALLFNGAPRDAVPSLEEAFEISSRMTTDPYEHAKLQWFLARALWEADHDRPRALELVRSARPTIVASTERDALLAREMDAWLAERNAD